MFPQMVRIRQILESPCVLDIASAMSENLQKYAQSIGLHSLAGKKIGITAGSRGIDSIPLILRSVADFVKGLEGRPFLIPAMGSHGGANVNDQIEILHDLGITEKTVGAPIIGNIETTLIGNTETGVPVHINRAVLELDGLIVVNRIKAHTDFEGKIESGICKMFAIGLGAYEGALTTHSYALTQGYEETIIGVASKMMDKVPIIAAIGILENWKGKTARIEVFSGSEIFSKEPLLLIEAKQLMVKLPVDKIDVLIIDEIGKNISGTGMDTKVVGRIMVRGQKEPVKPVISRIVVLDTTPESHGNVLGIGLADITTKKVFGKIDFNSTALNAISSMSPEQGRIPVVMNSDKDALKAALSSLGAIKSNESRIVHIRNTSWMEEMEISLPLLEELSSLGTINILGSPSSMRFGPDGTLVRI